MGERLRHDARVTAEFGGAALRRSSGNWADIPEFSAAARRGWKKMKKKRFRVWFFVKLSYIIKEPDRRIGGQGRGKTGLHIFDDENKPCGCGDRSRFRREFSAQDCLTVKRFNEEYVWTHGQS